MFVIAVKFLIAYVFTFCVGMLLLLKDKNSTEYKWYDFLVLICIYFGSAGTIGSAFVAMVLMP